MKDNNNIAYTIMVFFLLFIAIASVLLVKQYTGYTYLPGTAGYITEVKIIHKIPTAYWQAFYGVASMESGYNDTQYTTAYHGQVTQQHLFFNCLSPFEDTHEVYASIKSNPTWSDVRAGTVAMVDDYLNLNGTEIDSTLNTFTQNISVMLGDTNITNVPGMYTYVNGLPNTKFYTGILNVSGDIVFVSNIHSLTAGYRGQSTKYQMLVAVPNSSVIYYFFTDPYDECPEGYGTGFVGDGYITGYVLHNETGQPINNATVILGSSINYSDSNGFFNFTVAIGEYRIVGIKDSFETYTDAVNISIAQTTEHNISLVPYKGPAVGNGTLTGTITDNATQTTLEDAIVSIAGQSILTDANGNYTINVSEGTHNIIITKPSYKVHTGNVTITYDNTTIYNTNLSYLTGTVNGTVRDSTTNQPLQDVVIRIGGISTTTDSLGRYSSNIATGSYNIIATKNNYNTYTGNLTVYSGLTTTHNIYLNSSYGTINGIVLDNNTGSPLSNATISANGVITTTNSNGNYTLNVTTGTHNIIATKQDYNNYFDNVRVNPGSTTMHNINLSPYIGPQVGNGTLTGTITDDTTQSIIENAQVSVAGQSILTDANGNYTLNISAGTHNIVVIKSGYNIHTGNATIVYNNVTVYNANISQIIGPRFGNGTVQGYVTDRVTASAISNANITIYGQNVLTDTNGFYSINVTSGTHNIFASKEDYYNYTYEVTINHNEVTNHNIGLTYTRGYVTGIVKDSSTNLSIEDVTISAAGNSITTDSNGNYTLNITTGTHIIAATKEGYNAYTSNITVNPATTIHLNISIAPSAGVGVGNGTLEGYVTDNTTNISIENVTININGIEKTTNANGYYNLSLPTGNHNLIATKQDYNTHIGNVIISLNSITIHNFSMGPSRELIEKPNETQPLHAMTIIKNITAYVPELFNFTENLSTSVYVTLNTDQENVSVNGNIYNTLPSKTDSTYLENLSTPDFPHITDYYYFTSDVSSDYIENVTYEINYNEDSIPAFCEEEYLILYYFSPNSKKWEPQNVSLDMTTNNINLTLNHFSWYVIGSKTGIVKGSAKDNITGVALENVSVSIAGLSDITDSNGNYSLEVPAGLKDIIATKTGYNPYVNKVNVTPDNTTTYNIGMSPPGDIISNGTIQGYTKDSSTNALLTNVTISVAGRVFYPNASGFYSVEVYEGSYKIVAIKSGYDVFVGDVNVTAGNITNYNISMSQYVAPTDYTGYGSGTGTGAGTGTAATTVTKIPRIEKPVKEVGYEISIKRILKKIRVGNYVYATIAISNYKSEPMTIFLEPESSVAPLIRLDKDILNIDPGSSETINMKILGNVEPGIYEGNLVMSGDIDEKLPIDVLVHGKDKLQVEALLVKLDLLDRKVYTNDNIKFKVDLQNLLREEQYKVSLSYYIEDLKGTKHSLMEQEEVMIQTSFSLLKNFPLPENIKAGNYLLSVEASYLDHTSKHSLLFEVKEPTYKYALMGFIPLWILLVGISGLALIFLIVFIYNKNKRERKRYKTELEWAEMPKAGPRSAYVGHVAETTTKTYFDLDNFQVHTIVAGASGSGKTIIAQDLVEEALLKDTAVVVFDPTATWTGFLRKCTDKKMLDIYSKFGLKKTDTKAFNGNVHQVTNPREVIDFKKFMKPGEINIFVTNKLKTEDTEIFVTNTIREVFHENLPESKQLKFLMVYDGVHNLLPKFGGSGKVFVQIERAAREFRKWGIGLILISQVLSDFSGEILANINTEIQTRTRDEGDLKRVKTEYGDEILKSVVKASAGTAMVESSAYNKGKPYFISFRPVLHSIKRISDEELANYNKFNNTVDDLDHQIEQLEKEGIDVFDLKLELKLAKDKIKSGNFNMVSIYLDGLTPRIKGYWDKLGKKAKKREIKLVSEEELSKELEEAKKSVEEIQKEEQEGRKKKISKEDKIKEEEKIEKEIEGEEEKLKKDEERIEETEQKLEEYKKGIEDSIKILEKDKSIIESEEFKEMNDLIEKTYSFLEEGNKDKAEEIYDKIREIYRELPKSIKKKINKKCLDIHKKLSG